MSAAGAAVSEALQPQLAMAQFAPPPPQFASAPGDGKPPLVPMQPMLPVGAEQPLQQQQPIWATSSFKRDRQRQAASADTRQPPQNGTGGSVVAEAPAQAAATIAEPESWPNDSSSTQPLAEPVPQWTAEPEAALTSQHSPHKRQREGPDDETATRYASEDAMAQQWDHDQASSEQQPPEAAVSGEAAASARQRLQQLEREAAPLVQQRAEVRHNFSA